MSAGREVGLQGIVRLQHTGEKNFRNNEFAGTKGQSQALQGFRLKIDPPIEGLSLQYKGHFQDIGDLFAKEGEFLGDSREPRRLEGFAIELTGPTANKYDVVYKAHLEGVDDTQFFRNGEFCGTKGQSRRVEAILVRVVPRVNDSDYDALADVRAQLANRTLSEKFVMLELIRRDGMTEPRIADYCRTQGLAPPNMSALCNTTDWLTHDFEGIWRVKLSLSKTLRHAILTYNDLTASQLV